MSQLNIIDIGILYVNLDPAHQHVSAFFPNVVQLQDREFLCVYQRGDGMYSVNSNIACLRSTDSGKTWQEEGFIYDKSMDDRPYAYHCTFVSRLADHGAEEFHLKAEGRVR